MKVRHEQVRKLKYKDKGIVLSLPTIPNKGSGDLEVGRREISGRNGTREISQTSSIRTLAFRLRHAKYNLEKHKLSQKLEEREDNAPNFLLKDSC